MPPKEPSHAEIMHRIRCDTYASQAIAQVLGESRKHQPSSMWTRDEWLAISRLQKKMRAELGVQEPDAARARLRTQWRM